MFKHTENYYDARPRQCFDRLGIVIHAPELLFHFAPLITALAEPSAWNPQAADSFELVLLPSGDSSDLEVEAAVRQLGFDRFTVRHGYSLLQAGWGYKLLLSNHFLGFWPGQHLGLSGLSNKVFTPIRALGQANVRLLYDLGADAWNFSRWNHFYEAFLCFGEWHAQGLSSFRGRSYLCGYSRYDAFFQKPLSENRRQSLTQQWGGDVHKPNLIWFSTLGQYQGSLPWHAAAVAGLTSDYNLLVKPHPFSALREPAYLGSLTKHRYTHILQEAWDNVELLQWADYMLADYGALSFDGFYTRQNLLLLDHPEHERYFGPESSDAQLRQHVPHTKPTQTEQLKALLKQTQPTNSQEAALLKNQWFGAYQGQAAQRCAQVLLELSGQ